MGSQILANPEFSALQGCTQLAADNCGNSGAGWHGNYHGPRHETHKESRWQGTESTSGFDNADPQLGDTGRQCYTGRKGTELMGLVTFVGSPWLAALLSPRENIWTLRNTIQNIMEPVLPKAFSHWEAHVASLCTLCASPAAAFWRPKSSRDNQTPFSLSRKESAIL